MPDFLVTAAIAALKPVQGKLADFLKEEYKRFEGVRDEAQSLIRELAAIDAFLLKKSEEENLDVQEKEWMKEVRELSYDIEDSLDEFRVRVDDDSTKPDGFIDKCKKLLQLDKTKARHRIAKEIEKLKGQVKEVAERKERYIGATSVVINTNNNIVDPRALAIFEDASRLVGIDQPKQEIISFLTKTVNEDISTQQPKIISIVGIGGIGKTTLAKRVYEELKDPFVCRVFFSVSRNPDISGILRTILIKMTGRDCYMTDIQQLIMEINDFLQSKRYLVVIDDIWDVKTWEPIKCALPNNSCGSVIITTTRIHDVAKECCSSDGWVYQTKPLQAQDSKRLFQNRIFGPRNECPEYLKEVSDNILKKCGGLPLAIITISGLLASKARNGVHSVTEWEKVQTSIGHGLERDSTVEGMMRILSLSYFDLPFHLKACLLYLSIFPEDYEIRKDRLVRLWVAEGFIPAESTCTLYESGEKAFTELINRNLILPWRIKRWNGEVRSCRLHDIILDFIVGKSTEDNFVTVHGTPRPASPPKMKVRRLSLQGKTDGGDATIDSNQKYANVRSVISFGSACSLLVFRFLRVLDLTGRLENHHLANIGGLFQLRYFSLRNTSITELPKQIGMLQYLESLDVWGSRIYFPGGIKNMQALEWLGPVEIDMKAAAIFVEEIGDLTKMRHLNIAFSSIDGNVDKESYVHLTKKVVSSFQRLNQLETLKVKYTKSFEAGHDVIFNGDDIIIEVSRCSASLRKLVFKMNPMQRVPRWMKSLVNIEELKMRMKKLDKESLCILGGLQVLVKLTLEIVNDVEVSTDKEGILISNRHGFRSLRHFWFQGESMLTFEAGSMPKLEYLIIHFDADITISVSNGHLDFGLKHLSQLTYVEYAISGNEQNIWPVSNAIKKECDKQNHPNHPRVVSQHFPSAEDEKSSQSTVHTSVEASSSGTGSSSRKRRRSSGTTVK